MDDFFISSNKNKREINTLEELKKDFSECISNEFNPIINDWSNTGWTGMFNLDLIISYAIEKGASDIHLIGNQEICFTINGDIYKQVEFGIPCEYVMNDIVEGILNNQQLGYYVRDLEFDCSYTVRFGRYKGRRLRVNVGKSFNVDQITLRVINDEIPSMKSLDIDNNLFNLFNTSSGVILICGSTGAGKSTTLASIIREIQLTKRKKILTVEKPVEYIYKDDGLGLVVQRSIPDDCLDFESGLTSAMRSAPDIILIGEVRNKKEVDELLRAAETGHLALSTLHTSNNITTLSRIRSLYNGEEQKRILTTLGETLKCIVNQILVKTKEGNRIVVREILVIDRNIKSYIIEDNITRIREIQEYNKSTLEHQLVKLVKNGICHLEDARDKAPDGIYFDYLLKTLD